MVGRRAPELDGELHARSEPELVGVQAHAEPGRSTRLEHGAALVGVERAVLAEGIDPAGVRCRCSRASRHRRARRSRRLDPRTPAARRARRGTWSRPSTCDRCATAVPRRRRSLHSPDLISTVVTPARWHSAKRAAAPVARASSDASRVAAIVTLMPPAAYGAPAIRAANSALRSPANTRCVWLSTNPGITQRPAASIRSSACGATPVPTARTCSSSKTSQASASSPSSVFVTSSPMPSTTRAHGSASASSAATSMDTWCPSDTTTRPPMTTWWTSAAVAANTAVSMACSGPAARSAHGVEGDRRQVGESARLDPSCVTAIPG